MISSLSLQYNLYDFIDCAFNTSLICLNNNVIVNTNAITTNSRRRVGVIGIHSNIQPLKKKILSRIYSMENIHAAAKNILVNM